LLFHISILPHFHPFCFCAVLPYAIKDKTIAEVTAMGMDIAWEAALANVEQSRERASLFQE